MTELSKENIDTLLESKDKGIARATGIVSRLWRKVLYDLNITGNRWNTLMNRYINDPRNNVGADAKRKSWTRGNLNTELTGSEMTFYSLEKGIRFLGIKRITVSLGADWFSGHRTTHSVSALIEDHSDEDDDILLQHVIIRSDEELIDALVEAHVNNPARLAYIQTQVAERIKTRSNNERS